MNKSREENNRFQPLSVECCLKTKMRHDVMADTIGYI